MDDGSLEPASIVEPVRSHATIVSRRTRRRAAVILAVLFLVPGVVGAALATTVAPPGCWEWCGLTASVGRLGLGFAVGGLLLAAGTWRGNLFCMAIALFLCVLGLLIAGFALVTILIGGRNLAAVVPAALAGIAFGAPTLALSLSLLAMANEKEAT